MKLLIQRVKQAAVEVNHVEIAHIQKGLLVFLGIAKGDTEEKLDYLVKKLVHLRIFEDKQGKMNESVIQQKGELLIISQFTLYADCSHGNRPSFIQAQEPIKAKELYESFIKKCKKQGISTKQGEFGAQMQIQLINDGPVTIQIEC